jgi:Zn-dependent membrane protease YugP
MYLLLILIMGMSWFIQWRLRSKFEEYSKVTLSNNMSGEEIAKLMLKENGIYDVKVMSVEGQLTDHYDPTDKTVNLSHDVYYGRNAASAAVAAHECGHAVQHAKAYSMLQFRSSMVPMLSVTSKYMPWVLMGGILLLAVTPIPLIIGVVLFSFTTVFSFATLPVEFDASARALRWMKERNIVNGSEYVMSADALRWAALTYVVAALSSLATLIYYISILSNRSRN